MEKRLASRTNLPAALTSFVGREREIHTVVRLLGATRLLTLTGSGGVGKTRLALAAAAAAAGLYGAGVWLVELAALAHGEFVAQAVASVLGVPQAGGRPLLDALVDTIGDRPILLVLDNCEHLLDACAALCQPLLMRCPTLKILTTSRQPLGIEGETLWRVPGLSLPSETVTPEGLRNSEATALFLDRAASVRPGFVPSSEEAPELGEICRRLDGIPLAIELAAAWVKTLSVTEIANRLDDRFRLLSAGPRGALPHQQTLRSTLDWSYGLLTQPERVLLARLAVFEGGWTLAGAETVCEGDPLDREAILGLLGSLVDKSLVLVEPSQGGSRYSLLETTREYAAGRLMASEDAAQTRAQHAAHVLAFVEELDPLIFGPHQLAAMHRLDLEQENIRGALRWAAERGDDETALRLVAALWDYWWMRGRLVEGQRLVEEALARNPTVRSSTRARALHGAAILAAIQGDLASAERRLRDSVALYQDIGDRVGLIRPLADLATTQAFKGDFATATALSLEDLQLAREADQDWPLAYALHMFGQADLQHGEYASSLGFSEEAADVWHRIGDDRGLAHELVQLSIALRTRGEHARALDRGLEALRLFRNLGETWGIAGALVVIAAAHEQLERPGSAVRLLAAEDAFASTIGIALVIPHWQRDFSSTLDACREALTSREFDAAWTAGRGASIDQAIEYALTGDESAFEAHPESPGRGALTRLTPREREVAVLVARGLSDRDIADTLVVSRRTAENHVHHVLLKLGFRSRSDLVDWAPRLGLEPRRPG